jgi:hypothetical protein
MKVPFLGILEKFEKFHVTVAKSDGKFIEFIGFKNFNRFSEKIPIEIIFAEIL